jgi:oligopeptide/dipeptide ABC transporter ATP-binding protein
VVREISHRVMVMYLGRVVETTTRDQLYAAPRHPYTQALLSAAPIPDPVRQRTRRRIVLSGEVPSPIAPPPGCRFHPRCPVATELCTREVPPLRSVGPAGALVACHLVNDDGSGPRLLDVHTGPAHSVPQQEAHA